LNSRPKQWAFPIKVVGCCTRRNQRLMTRLVSLSSEAGPIGFSTLKRIFPILADIFAHVGYDILDVAIMTRGRKFGYLPIWPASLM
jgi:hypothetical protein